MQGICNNGQCVNAQGGFQCECKQGYALDGEGKDCLGRQQKGIMVPQLPYLILERGIKSFFANCGEVCLRKQLPMAH